MILEQKKTVHDPIGLTISPFSQEDLNILDAQIRFIDLLEDENWFSREVNKMDLIVASASQQKRHLFESLKVSKERRIYLENRKLYIQEQMEISRQQRATVASEARKLHARTISSDSSTKRSSDAPKIPPALRNLLLQSKGQISEEDLRKLGIL